MLWFNRFMVMNRLVFGVSGRVVLFAFCFWSLRFPLRCIGEREPAIGQLKQDMELVSRELAGLRTEVELLRRENAQLRVSVEQLTRRQNSASGTSQSLTQQVDTRLQALERRASQGEKEQVALRKNIDKQLKRSPCRDKQSDFPSQSILVLCIPLFRPKLFLELPSNGVRTQNRKGRNG